MFGKRFSELESGGKESIEELLEKMVELVGTPNVGDFLPCIAWMDLQGIDSRRCKKVAVDLREAFNGIIDACRLANKDAGRLPTNNFLEVLLQASDIPIHIMEVLQVGEFVVF